MMSDRHFQGNGIRLRAPEPEDLEVMFRFENATDVWEMSNTTGPYSRFQLKQYIEQTQNDLFADRQLRLMIETGTGRWWGWWMYVHLTLCTTGPRWGLWWINPVAGRG